MGFMLDRAVSLQLLLLPTRFPPAPPSAGPPPARPDDLARYPTTDAACRACIALAAVIFAA